MAYSKTLEYHQTLASISASAKLIAHPARMTLLLQLSKGPATLAQLAEDHPLRMVSVSNHLRALLRAGIVHVRNSNQKSIYTTDPETWPAIVTSTMAEASRLQSFRRAA